MIQEFQQLQFPSEGEVGKRGKGRVGDVVSEVSVRCLPMLGVIGVRSGGFPKHEVA